MYMGKKTYIIKNGSELFVHEWKFSFNFIYFELFISHYAEYQYMRIGRFLVYVCVYI